MVILRPATIRRMEESITSNKKWTPLDAQVTSEAELAELLEAVDDMSEEDAKESLGTVIGLIWDGRKKIAKGRKVRRMKDLQASIRQKSLDLDTEIQEKQDEMAEYIREFYG